jgi:hypothetical protein
MKCNKIAIIRKIHAVLCAALCCSVVVYAAVPKEGWALSCGQLNQEKILKDSDVIFIGEVLSQHPNRNANDPSRIDYVVESCLKGCDNHKKLSILTNNLSLLYDSKKYKIGNKVLVLAKYLKGKGNVLYTGSCNMVYALNKKDYISLKNINGDNYFQELQNWHKK